MRALKMRKVIALKITQEHIDKGQPGDGFACPIALAISGRFPDSCPEVATDEIAIHEFIYKPDRAGKVLIDRFDSGKKVKPKTILLVRA